MSSIATIVVMCAACHGSNGVSSADHIPNLAGQKEKYMYQELVKFQQDTRVSVMNGVVKGITDKQLKELAKHFANLKQCK